MRSFVGQAARKPIAVMVCALVIAVLGWVSWNKLPLDLFPDLQSPTILVALSSGDRPAEQMEKLYGEKIEQLLFTVNGLKSVDVTARRGSLIARVTFDWNNDIDLALVDVNRALSPIASNPDIDDLKIKRFDTHQLPTLVYGLTANSQNLALAELRTVAKKQIAPTLEQLEGVAEVRVSGGRVREVQVQVDQTLMRAYDLSVEEIRSKISGSNIDFNAGSLEEEGKVVLVRGKSRFVKPEDIEQVVLRFITNERGEVNALHVADIARVSTVDADISALVRVNGKEGIGLFIYKESGANTVAVSKTVNQAMEDLQHNLTGVTFSQISNEAALIEDAVADVKDSAVFGVVLSLIVLALFLRSPGPIVIIALAVPISLLATFFAMSLAGLSLNLITLGGLALGAGILVDNAIVVIESIFRHRAAGESPLVAAEKGTRVIGGAIIASTFTSCIVFLPVLFIDGLASKLVAGISFTVVVSLLASLLVSMLLIPALSVTFLPQKKARDVDPGSKRLEDCVYRILAKPRRVIVATGVLVALAFLLLARLGTELLPPSDPRSFSLRLIAPPGQQVEATERNVANVESILTTAAGKSFAAMLSEVGRLDDDDRLVKEESSDENTAEMRVRLNAGSETASTVISKARPAIEKLYGTDIDWRADSSALTQALGNAGPPVVVQINGNSLEELRTTSEKIQAKLQHLDALWNVKTSFEGAAPELHLRLKQAVADGLGIDINTIRAAVEAALDGVEVTTMYLGDEGREVRLRLASINSQQLMNLTLQSPEGKLFTLADIAHLTEEPGAREILRHNQKRIAQVTAAINKGFTQAQARDQVQKLLQDMDLPLGVTASLAGEEKERERTVAELRWAALLAVVLVFMVLAGTFESLLQPFSVLSAVPIALIGVAIVMVPQGQPLGIMAMLGLVVLVGVSVNDAILLAQTARSLSQRGIDTRTALARAAGLRLRPIIMTSATTVLSLLPMAIGGGEAAQLRSPLALTVIGGIIAATLGSLFVIPCIYLSLENLGHSLRIKKVD